MSLKRGELRALVDELRPLLVGATVLSFNAIDTRKFVLLVRQEEQNRAVLLCLQEPFLRLHRWSGTTQGSDNPFAKKISGLIIEAVELLNQDRIVSLTFHHQGSLIAEFFPRRPNLFFVDAAGDILLALNPVENKQYQVPPNPFQNDIILPDPTVSSAGIEAFYWQKESEAAFLKEKQAQQHLWNQRAKRARKALDKAQMELDKCRAWEAVQHEGQLLQANMFKMRKGLPEVTIEDWMAEGASRVIALDVRLEPKDEIAKRFKMSKKLKAGVAFAEKRVAEAQEEASRCEAELKRLETVETWDDLGPLKKPEGVSKPKPMPTLPYHTYQTESGLSIWVGKHAQGNEKLTFSVAKGSDWWLHVSDYPGSHVIIRVPKNQEPDAESLQDAMQVALAYSKAKDKGEADITVTQCKYVSRLKRGSPGKVQISKHQTLHARFDPARFEKIKQRGSQ